MASQTVRSFLAIELSQELKTEAQSFLKPIQDRLSGFRFIPPQNWHLTLHFLGQAELSKIEQFASHLPEFLSGIKPFSISLSGFGAFPSAQSPKILWVGISGDVQRLLELKRKLDPALEKACFKIETKPFHPHVTVARSKVENTRFDAKLNQEFLGKATGRVNQITLFKSDLTAQGAVYTPLNVFPFSSFR